MLNSASLRGRQVWGRRSERQAGDVTPEMALTDEFTCGQEKSLPGRETVHAKGSDPGGGAFVGKELAPGSGSKGLQPSQTRRRQKFVLRSQENILQGIKAPCSGIKPHSDCPAGRRLAHTDSYVDLSCCWFRKGR